MRFGTFVPQGWRFDLVGIAPEEQWPTMLRLARRADANPDWESIWVYDHFHTTPEPSEEATHEAWSLMAAFGASTDRVRLGQMCTCMAYRNPAYLAKVAATTLRPWLRTLIVTVPSGPVFSGSESGSVT